MPPHCDSMDGPVVKAAMRALDEADVGLVLPFVPENAEGEVRRAFDEVIEARRFEAARALADRSFFETVVRVHRAGEGEPFTGLKPAGLDVGPVIPVAERAIETGSPDEVIGVLDDVLREQVKGRLDRVMTLQRHAEGPVPQARDYVEAMLGFQVWAHKAYRALMAEPWEDSGAHRHA